MHYFRKSVYRILDLVLAPFILLLRRLQSS